MENGCIVGTTKVGTPNSFLCTDRKYANFILELEFKVPPGMNSGIQIRSICDPAIKNGRVHGYQVEIDPSPRAWTAGIYDEARRGWLYNLTHIEKERGKAAAEAAKKAFRPNQWNHVRVEAIGPSIKTWLNHVPIADLVDDMTLEGIIALQVHQTGNPTPKHILWRNLRIQELDKGMKPALDQAWKTMLTWTYGASRKALLIVQNIAEKADAKTRADLEKRALLALTDDRTSPDARRFLCGLLEHIGTERSVATLAHLTTDPATATAARNALQDMPYDSVDKALQKALALPLTPDLKTGLLVSIGQRGKPAAAAAIAPYLTADDPHVRLAAVRALGAVGGPLAETRLRALVEAKPDNREAGQALVACGARALGRHKAATAAEVSRFLLARSTSPFVKAGALHLLAQSDPAHAVPDVLSALRGDQAPMFDVAVRCVRDTTTPEMLSAAIAALPQLRPENQIALLAALAAHSDAPAAAPTVARLLDGKNEAVRTAAATTLGRIGSAADVPRLVALAGTSSPAARAATQALGRLRGKKVDQALLGTLDANLPPAAKAAVLNALVTRDATETVPDLVHRTGTTTDPEVQRAIWKALRGLAGSKQLAPMCNALFQVDDGKVRREAEKAVAEVARKVEPASDRTTTLLAALDRAPDTAKPFLVRLLGRDDVPAVQERLIRELDSDNALCRYEAVKALAAWPTPAPYDALEAYAEKTKDATHNALAIRGCLRLLDLRANLPEKERLAALKVLENHARRPEERALIQAAKTNLRIADIRVGSKKAYTLIRRGFVKGKPVYIDRDYVFVDIPKSLAHADLLMTSMDDKASRGNSFVTFTINRAATVVVGYDGRARTPPKWLRDWTKMGESIRTTDRGCALVLYGKRFDAGKVVLPGNNPVKGVGAMYTLGISSAPLLTR